MMHSFTETLYRVAILIELYLIKLHRVVILAEVYLIRQVP
jgi:hypothetical protein